MWLMTPTKTRPHKPMLAEWTSEILSLSLIPQFVPNSNSRMAGACFTSALAVYLQT